MRRLCSALAMTALLVAPAFADGREGQAKPEGPAPLKVQREAGPVYHTPTAADCAMKPGGRVYSSHGSQHEKVKCAGTWIMTDRVIYSETYAPYVETVTPIVHHGPTYEHYSSKSHAIGHREAAGLKLDASSFDGGVGAGLSGGYAGHGPVVIHVVKPYTRRGFGGRILRGGRGH
ncbi:MAG: hypothetical protein AAGB25_09685 [Pseudomonadota bacterium]